MVGLQEVNPMSLLSAPFVCHLSESGSMGSPCSSISPEIDVFLLT